jgi:hypothetical protein
MGAVEHARLGVAAAVLATLSGISTDSRSLLPGELFVPLRGERYDGHRFLAQAAQRGAAACLSEEEAPGLTTPVVRVADTLTALGDLAAGHRQAFPLPLVAVTGSSGKTTTKEMVAAILAQEAPGLATAGNFNNLIGVPLTLFRLSPEHRWIVLELGNPSCFAGPGTMPCPEIWAWGFRNPWRFGIDPMTGDMWVGDVGQAAFEEVDQVLPGLNYGWDCREGNQNFEFTGPCTTATLEPPEAVHPRTDARAITGGAVYRGTDIPELDGFFVYGDFATGNVWALDTTTDSPPRKLNLPVHNVAAFGQDVDGEIYLVTFSTPSIYALVPGDGG